jgi:hypothetical protein
MQEQSSEFESSNNGPILVQINDFEKDNKKFQKFKDKRERNLGSPDHFESDTRPQDQKASYTDVNIVQLSCQDGALEDVNKSQGQLNDNRFLRRISTSVYADDQTSIKKTSATPGPAYTQKASNYDYKTPHDNSRNHELKCNEDDMVEFDDIEIAPNKIIQSSIRSSTTKKPKFRLSLKSRPSTESLLIPNKPRRNRDMREGKKLVSDYMKRPLINLYTKPRTIKK